MILLSELNVQRREGEVKGCLILEQRRAGPLDITAAAALVVRYINRARFNHTHCATLY